MILGAYYLLWMLAEVVFGPLREPAPHAAAHGEAIAVHGSEPCGDPAGRLARDRRPDAADGPDRRDRRLPAAVPRADPADPRRSIDHSERPRRRTVGRRALTAAMSAASDAAAKNGVQPSRGSTKSRQSTTARSRLQSLPATMLTRRQS